MRVDEGRANLFETLGDLIAALEMNTSMYGESYNIGTGTETSLDVLAQTARELFSLSDETRFDPVEARAWDTEHWFADPRKAELSLGWKYRTPLSEGLFKTYRWWEAFLKESSFETLTKKRRPARTKNSVSAVIACYKD